MSKRKPTLSGLAAQLGKLGGKAGKGQSKARTPEQARKANAASHEAKRRKKEQLAQSKPQPPEQAE